MILTTAPAISKIASRSDSYRRRIYDFPNARSAFRAALLALGMKRGFDEVLLPAYVGWSSREGSGVMDPIRELGLKPLFYRMTSHLRIDVDDLCLRLTTSRARVLVLIHYFGFPDPEYKRVCQLAREHGLIVVEDEAHSMLSDLVGGVCGRLGEFSIMSLHKLLPVPQGGLLVVNNVVEHTTAGAFQLLRNQSPGSIDFCEYDTFSIAKQRRRHAARIVELLAHVPQVELLMPLSDGVVPQTLPIVLKSGCRDSVYHQLNSDGFGVVSLYHTMVPEINEVEYPDAHWLAKRVLNLPVHQDINPDLLAPMVDRLSDLLRS
jgi:dTDP-4-amino-4,6-dideoxygalactose transaminase